MPNPITVIFAGNDDNPFVVIDKPALLPSAPLVEGQESALTEAVRLFPEIVRVAGRKPVEKGLVHRLDTATRGLLLIARTQEAYNFFIDEQQNDRFCKTYTAFCDFLPDAPAKLGGFPAFPFPEFLPPASFLPSAADAPVGSLRCSSRFRFWGRGRKEVRPVRTDSASSDAASKKAGNAVYTTDMTIGLFGSADGEQMYRAECNITRGFRHQVRCHLAWSGFPVIGDALYYPKPQENIFLFCASGIAFRHPLTKADLTFNLQYAL